MFKRLSHVSCQCFLYKAVFHLEWRIKKWWQQLDFFCRLCTKLLWCHFRITVTEVWRSVYFSSGHPLITDQWLMLDAIRLALFVSLCSSFCIACQWCCVQHKTWKWCCVLRPRRGSGERCRRQHSWQAGSGLGFVVMKDYRVCHPGKRLSRFVCRPGQLDPILQLGIAPGLRRCRFKRPR